MKNSWKLLNQKSCVIVSLKQKSNSCNYPKLVRQNVKSRGFYGNVVSNLANRSWSNKLNQSNLNAVSDIFYCFLFRLTAIMVSCWRVQAFQVNLMFIDAVLHIGLQTYTYCVNQWFWILWGINSACMHSWWLYIMDYEPFHFSDKNINSWCWGGLVLVLFVFKNPSSLKGIWIQLPDNR